MAATEEKKRANRRRMLKVKQAGLRKEGEHWEREIKKLSRKELGAKALVAADVVAGLATGTAAAKTAVKAAAAKAAAKATAKKKADAKKALTSPSKRRQVRKKLHANRKAATPKSKKQRPNADEWEYHMRSAENERLYEGMSWRQAHRGHALPESRARVSQRKRSIKKEERKKAAAREKEKRKK